MLPNTGYSEDICDRKSSCHSSQLISSLSSSVLKYLLHSILRPDLFSYPVPPHAAQLLSQVRPTGRLAGCQLPAWLISVAMCFASFFSEPSLGNQKSEDFSNMNAIARTTSSELKPPTGLLYVLSTKGLVLSLVLVVEEVAEMLLSFLFFSITSTTSSK